MEQSHPQTPPSAELACLSKEELLVKTTAFVDPTVSSVHQDFLDSEGDIPYQEFVKTTFANTHEIDMHTVCIIMDQLHAIYGFVGEFIEYENELRIFEQYRQVGGIATEALARQNAAVEKEIGDMCYYAYMIHNLTTPGRLGLTNIKPAKDRFETHQIIEHVADLFKKKIFYKHIVNLEFVGQDLIKAVKFFAELQMKPIEYFILQNKVKLQKRYPSGKFSSQDAAEKKDKE